MYGDFRYYMCRNTDVLHTAYYTCINYMCNMPKTTHALHHPCNINVADWLVYIFIPANFSCIF